MGNRTCPPSCPVTRLVMALLVMVTWGRMVTAEKEAGGVEGCDGRALGDKWFDGCQWCVCTQQGLRCSSSACSSLVQHVPVCHVRGQRWTDGCYRCQCGRQGIACDLDPSCRLLPQRPVPCLADQRCVCGPDGVPSCTAEVIDRRAFVARRIRLGFPQVLESGRGSHDSYRGRPGGHRSHKGHRGHRGHVIRGDAEDGPSLRSRQRRMLLPPVEDRLSLHHSHARQGQITIGTDTDLPFSNVNGQKGLRSADQSSQELLITSDNLCRFGARWYGGSLRCFCDQDGSIACGNPVFVLAFFDDFRVEGEQCEEGHSWKEGCAVCTCQVDGLVLCNQGQHCGHHRPQGHGSHLSDGDVHLGGVGDVGNSLSAGVVDVALPSTISPHVHQGGAGCRPGRQWREGCRHCRCTRHARPLCSVRHCGPGSVHTALLRHDAQPDIWRALAASNLAREIPASGLPLRRSRRPMLVAPKPSGLFRVPAYAAGSGMSLPRDPCGQFGVGHKYWDDCNLCLCTSRGPRCQGKLCH